MIHLLLQKPVQSSRQGLHLFGSAQIPNEIPCSGLCRRHSQIHNSSLSGE